MANLKKGTVATCRYCRQPCLWTERLNTEHDRALVWKHVETNEIRCDADNHNEAVGEWGKSRAAPREYCDDLVERDPYWASGACNTKVQEDNMDIGKCRIHAAKVREEIGRKERRQQTFEIGLWAQEAMQQVEAMFEKEFDTLIKTEYRYGRFDGFVKIQIDHLWETLSRLRDGEPSPLPYPQKQQEILEQAKKDGEY